MNLLFVHDHRFQHDDSGVLYTVGSFPASIWQRYLDHFSKVRVLARKGGKKPQDSVLSPSSANDVSFCLVSPLSIVERLGYWIGNATKTIKKEVEAADAVVVRLPSDLGLLAANYAQKIGKPLMVETVGCAFDAYGHHGSVGSQLYAPIAFLRMRHAVWHAPFVLYVTNEWLQKRYPTRGETISASNVVIHPADAQQLELRRQRLKQLATGAHPVIGTIASLSTASKGIQTALASIASLQSRGIQLEYRILGAGDPTRWKKQAHSLGIDALVHFDGTRPAGAAVAAWLDGIDIYIQPSFQEGLPRGLLEAMSRGCVGVGSTAGGIPELLPNIRTHQPGESKVLAEILLRLFNSPNEVFIASDRDRQLTEFYYQSHLAAKRHTFFAKFRQSLLLDRKF